MQSGIEEQSWAILLGSGIWLGSQRVGELKLQKLPRFKMAERGSVLIWSHRIILSLPLSFRYVEGVRADV